MSKILLLFLVLCIASFPINYTGASAEDFPDLVIITEQFRPYNFVDNGKLKGIAVDLLEKMLEKVGSDQTRKDFQVMDWPRGYGLTLRNPMYVLFSTSRTYIRENLFKWAGPIDTVVTEMFAKKSAKIKIKTFDDLKKYRVGTIINDAGEQLLIENGFPSDLIYRVVKRDQIRKLLYSGRIDLTPDDKKGFMDYARLSGYNPDDFESVYVLNKRDLYYAFNKDTPDWIVEELQHALDSLKKEGTYRKILEKYGVSRTN